MKPKILTKLQRILLRLYYKNKNYINKNSQISIERLIMFRSIYNKFLCATLFEKLLLVVGITISIFGFKLINKVYFNDPGLTWPFLTAVFLAGAFAFATHCAEGGQSDIDDCESDSAPTVFAADVHAIDPGRLIKDGQAPGDRLWREPRGIRLIRYFRERPVLF